MMRESFIDDLAVKLSKIGTIRSVGEEWVSYTGKIPSGGIPYIGQEVSRETYADLWSYAQSAGLVKSESDWQSLSSSQNGNVPFYSSGDGSSTFRMPRVSSYLKGAESVGQAGSYIKQGLPNITGSGCQFRTLPDSPYREQSGALYYLKNNGDMYQSGGGDSYTGAFDASRSNSIYGRSEDVTPETVGIVIGVYAFGVVSNPGAVDAASLASAIARVEATYLPTKGGAMSGRIANLSSNGQMTIVREDLTIGTNPSVNQYTAIHFSDKTGLTTQANRVATVEHSVTTEGVSGMNIGPYQWIAGKTSYTGCFLKLNISSTGACTSSVNASFTATSVQATSDSRLKSDITDYSVDLSSLGTYHYTLNSDGKKHVGLIAQEVKEVIPEAVSTDDDGYYSLDYNAIVAVLVGKVNDLEKRLKELEVN